MKNSFISDRIFVILIILLVSLTKLYGAIHLIGSLEWPYYTENAMVHRIPIVKIKQDLIKRKGLIWFLEKPMVPTTYLLKDSANCGLLILESDSTVACEIKKSIDLLSESNDTFCVEYIYAHNCPTLSRPFNYNRFRGEENYRDSLHTDITLLIRMSAEIFNRGGNKCWFLPDSSLYYSADCFLLFRSFEICDLFDLYSIEEKYVKECEIKGFTPMFIERGYSLPDSFKTKEAINNPEIQLLYKYINMNDSIILNTPFKGRTYDLNIEYDHNKASNLSPSFFKYQKWDTLKNKLHRY